VRLGGRRGTTVVDNLVLNNVADLLSQHYGVRFDSIGLNYYRHGRDSVAWHRDRVRFALQRPRVAILSLGSPRGFGLRPRGGGAGRWFTPQGGDLLVMGGRSQHDWEHAVPKQLVAGRGSALPTGTPSQLRATRYRLDTFVAADAAPGEFEHHPRTSTARRWPLRAGPAPG
jgi:hypothetical protein